MRSRTRLVVIAACLAASMTSAAAQVGGKPTTGNPTPGTPQPDPPNLADRVTFVGCLRAAPNADRSVDGNTPGSSRFVLMSAERQNRVPAGTGGSAVALAASSKTYRLEGIDSQFSPFVGAKVEISGEIRPPSAGEKANPPTLLVEFVQKIAASCS